MNKFDALFEAKKEEMRLSVLTDILKKSSKFPLKKDVKELLDGWKISKNDQEIIETYFENAIEEAAMDLDLEIEDDKKVFGGQKIDWNNKVINFVAQSMKELINLNPNLG